MMMSLCAYTNAYVYLYCPHQAGAVAGRGASEAQALQTRAELEEMGQRLIAETGECRRAFNP